MKMIEVLDIGGGINKLKYKNKKVKSIDILPSADIVHDLNVFPYPIHDNSFDVINSTGVLEHLKHENRSKVLQEIHRIARPNAEVYLEILTGFYNGIDLLEHQSFWGVSTFKGLNQKQGYDIKSRPDFKVEKIRLRWSKNPRIIMRLLDKVFTFLANLNVSFCERFWQFWVGGFDYVQVWIRVVK